MRAGILNLLLLMLYSAHATVPVVASFLHAADHRLAEARQLYGTALPDRTAPIGTAHSHDNGDHHHDQAGAHGASVEALLAAADALEHDGDPDAVSTPLRLTAHVVSAGLSLVWAPDRVAIGASSASDPAVRSPNTPPTPPPRNASRHIDARTA
jgi:hypothetical protein